MAAPAPMTDAERDFIETLPRLLPNFKWELSGLYNYPPLNEQQRRLLNPEPTLEHAA